MFAIVDIAGSQEKVAVGDRIRVPLLEGEANDTMTFDNVLLLADGDKVTIGAPLVGGASVEAKVIEHGRGDKIRVVKMLKRKRYKRVKGHRQHYTSVEITGIKTK